MKNIIVPTDFSACADNALRYAIGLAKQLEAKLHVVYVHTANRVVVQGMPPVIETDVSNVVILPIPDMAYKQMDAIERKLRKDYDLDFECYVQEGFLDDTLIDLSEQKKDGLIVMGTHGAHDTLSFWSDSNTAKMVERKKVSVLSVPEAFKGELSSKAEFVMATDFELINDWSIMDTFYELALKLKANINVFYVKERFQEKGQAAYEKEIFDELIKFYEGLNVTLTHSIKDNIVSAVDDFAEQKKASLVMMVAHERGWLDELFHHSVTKDMALHGHVPLLSIPDNHAELNKAYSTNYW